MTPLAQELVNKYYNDPVDGEIAQYIIKDTNFFEVSEVLPLAVQLINACNPYINDRPGRIDHKLIFLPAPKMWIEWDQRVQPDYKGRDANGVAVLRTAVILREVDDDRNNFMIETIVKRDNNGSIEIESSKMMRLLPKSDSNPVGAVLVIYAILTLINNPKIIGRRQHMPHRGLERKLLKSRFSGSYFPLRAWTEIMLKVTPTRDARQDPSVEAHYTGRRAMHFCRAHLRLWDGKLIFVSSHWRGDPTLGIKQSRYRVVA